MPTTIVTTDNFAAGILYAPVAGDTLIIAAGVSVGSTSAPTINMQGSARLQVFGMVYQNEGTFAVLTDSSANNSISIMAGGGVVARGDAEPTIYQAGGMLTNAGLVQSDLNHAILANGDTRITNSGTIQAGRDGILLTDIDAGGSVVNDGVIRAGLLPGSDGDGITVFGSGAQVLNTGQISTQAAAGAGISVGFAGTFANFFASDVGIVNHGTISALSGYGITAVANGTFGIEVLNTGLITGGIMAVQGSAGADIISNFGTLAVLGHNITGVLLGDGADVLRNRGVIDGRVDMGTGADRFDGALGDQGDYVLGGVGNDTLIGGAFDDFLYGGADNDQTFGGGGDDELIDAEGQDTIFGGAGDDVIAAYGVEGGALFGGLGDDRIGGSVAADTLTGNAGDDTLTGDAGADVYGISGLGDVVTELSGGGVADEVTSGAVSLDLNLYAFVERATLTGAGALRLTGSAGANVLTGNVAANVITGGAGADTIAGGGGADVMTGGTGRDSLTGGTGADVFVWLSAAETGLGATTRDVITDFVPGVDDLRMIFMDRFIGAAGFTAPGQVRYNAATGVLSGNTDADASSEWTLQMATGLALTTGDFVF